MTRQSAQTIEIVLIVTNVRVKIQRKYGYIRVSSRSGSMIGILMKRMLAKNAQTLRHRFFLRRRISTLACSPLSI